MKDFDPNDDMLRRYIQKNLDTDEEVQLELWLASHPQAIRKLEFDLALQEALTDIHRRPLATQTSHSRRWLTFLQSPLRAGALSLALFIAGTISFALYTSLHSRAPDTITPNPRVIYLEQTRGPHSITEITKSPNISSFVIIILLDEPISDYYQLELIGGNGKILERETDLWPSAEGELSLILPASRIPPGEFRLVIRRVSSHNHTAEFILRLI